MYDFNYFQFMDGDWCLEYKKISDDKYFKPTYQKLLKSKEEILEFINNNKIKEL